MNVCAPVTTALNCTLKDKQGESRVKTCAGSWVQKKRAGSAHRGQAIWGLQPDRRQGSQIKGRAAR